MNRNDLLRTAGMAAMFVGGFLGAQSLWWGWITALAGLAVMGLVFWLQRPRPTRKTPSSTHKDTL